MKEVEINEHNKIIDKDTIRSRFVCVHNDTFCRCFKDTDDILEHCKMFNDNHIKIDFEITVLSQNKAGEVNAFLLDVFYKDAIEWLDDFGEDTNLFGLCNLDSVQYYHCTACAFAFPEHGKNKSL